MSEAWCVDDPLLNRKSPEHAEQQNLAARVAHFLNANANFIIFFPPAAVPSGVHVFY